MKKPINILILSFLLFPAEKISANPPDTLVVLTWNIYMLPWLIRNNQEKRAKAIGEVLKNEDIDVIVFQEAFHGRAYRIIKEEIKHKFPFQFGPGKGGLFRFNSGIWIVSKQPILRSDTKKYKRTAHADRLAKKSAVFIETEKNNQRFQIIGTHLQSQNYLLKYRKIRERQFDVIKELCDKYLIKGIPQIIAGDLNTNKKEEHAYCKMIERLDADDGDLCGELKHTANDANNDIYPEPPAGTAELIDYILFRPNSSDSKIIKREAIRYRKLWFEWKEDLSDHYAVKGFIVINKK